jgi:hypothetical protein
MSTFSFQCPECDATLRSNNGAPPGKRVKCPTCQAIFAMPDRSSPERPAVAESPAAIRDKPASLAPRRRLDEEDREEEPTRSKRNGEDREDDVPRSRAKNRVRDVDEEEDQTPRGKAKRRVDEDEVIDDEEPPRRSRPRDDDDDVIDEEYREEDDAPPRKAKRRVREEEEADEEERPRRSKRRRDDDEDIIDEEYREEDDDEERPRRKKRKKKRKAQRGSRAAVLIIVGSLLLLLLAGGGTAAYFIWFHGVNWGSGNEEPWAFVHPDANVVFSVDVASLANDPAIGPQIEQALRSRGGSANFEQIKKETGLEFKELFAQTVVAMTVDPNQGANPFAGLGGGRRGSGNEPSMTLALKTSRSFSQKKVADSFKNARQKKLNGKIYYEIDEAPFKFAFMPSNRTLIMTSAPESQLNVILGASNDKPTLSADAVSMIRTMDKHTAWAAVPFTGKVRDVMQEAIKQQPGIIKPMADAMSQAKGFGFWANLDANTLMLGFSLFCADANTASQLANQAQGALQQQKADMGALDMFLGMLPKTKQAIKELTESFQYSAQDTRMVGSGQVSRQTVNDVIQEFRGLAGGMQGGGALGGGMPGGGMPGGMGPGGPPGGGNNPGGGNAPGGGKKSGGGRGKKGN